MSDIHSYDRIVDTFVDKTAPPLYAVVQANNYFINKSPPPGMNKFTRQIDDSMTDEEIKLMVENDIDYSDYIVAVHLDRTKAIEHAIAIWNLDVSMRGIMGFGYVPIRSIQVIEMKVGEYEAVQSGAPSLFALYNPLSPRDDMDQIWNDTIYRSSRIKLLNEKFRAGNRFMPYIYAPADISIDSAGVDPVPKPSDRLYNLYHSWRHHAEDALFKSHYVRTQ
jgi:hypothetical protein